MPGITGIFSKDKPEKNIHDLNLMIGAMTHDPAYSVGTHAEEKLGLYVGWVCHKGSFSDCMPLMNGKKDLLLVFSGEDFAGDAVVHRLKARGHEADLTNARYLVNLYEEDPAEFFKRLNGWFSGILVDFRENKVFLFNDRYGMGRIYYHEGERDFIFSSEAKALLRIRPELRKVHPESLAQFFAWDCVLNDRTFFPGIFLLPGGSRWTFRQNCRLEKGRYFKPGEWENRPVLGKNVFFDRLAETFVEVLPRYFRSRSPIAMAMSSGLDTRAIMACLDVAPGELPCHTFSGIYRETLDAKIGRKIARACGQPHEVLRLDRNFLSDFADHARNTVYVSDGCLNVNGSYDGYFNELVRRTSPIRMTGKFGSEVIRSNSMLRKPFVFPTGFFDPDFQEFYDQALKALEESRKVHDLTFALFKEIPWNEYGRLSLEMSRLTLRTPYMDNDLVKLMYQAPPGVRDSLDIIIRIIEHGNPALLEIMTDRGTAGQLGFPFSNLARLYFNFFEKSEYYFLVGIPHGAARMEKYVSSLHPEKLFAGRHQLGYFRIWYRGILSDYVRDVLLDDRTTGRGYLNRDIFRKMVLGHTRGYANHTGVINKMLTAELIYRSLLEDL